MSVLGLLDGNELNKVVASYELLCEKQSSIVAVLEHAPALDVYTVILRGEGLAKSNRLVKQYTEGATFRTLSEASQKLEEVVSCLCYQDQAYQVIDSDSGESFPSLLDLKHLQIKGLPKSSAVVASQRFKRPVQQKVEGGLRAFVHVDLNGAPRAATFLDGDLYDIALDPGARLFIQELFRRAGLTNALFEVWLNRSKVIITDAVFRDVAKDYSMMAFELRMNTLASRLPRAMVAGKFNSRVELPKKLPTERSFDALNKKDNAAPCQLVRSGLSGFVGFGETSSILVDDESPIDVMLSSCHGKEHSGYSEKYGGFISFKTPVSINVCKCLNLAGIRENPAVRPVLY